MSAGAIRPRPWSAGRRSASAFACVSVVVAVALGAGRVLAQSPATITVDHVRVSGNGRHHVIVSVLDASGAPVPRLDQAFRVTLDGAPVEDLVVAPARDRRSTATVTLVVDGALLRGESLAAVQDAVRELARGLAPDDRLRIVAVGEHARTREAGVADADRLAGELGGMVDEATPLVYDALYDAAREAARLPSSRAGAILVLTRGSDGGSRHGSLEVLAMARLPQRLTPIMVVLLGDTGVSPEADRLRRLAAHAGGALTVVTSPFAVASRLPSLAARALDHWLLSFRAPGWDRHAAGHRIGIVVEAAGAHRSVEATYDTRDVLVAPWWSAPLLWLTLLAAAVLAVAGLALTRRRQRGLLVHDHDADDGVWYELFAFPVTLGAVAGNDIVFQDEQVSRNHAVLERKGRIVELVDLNSENGTFVNGERVTRRTLADGDRLSLGSAVHVIYEARG